MRKRKAQVKPPQTSNIQEFLDTQDPHVLVGALASLENSMGWELMKSFMFYNAATHASVASALCQTSGRHCEASSASAKADVLREVADTFLIQLQQKIAGKEGIIDGEVPQD